MAIVKDYKQYLGRRGDRRDDGSRGYTAEWIVRTDSVDDDAAIVLADPALPAIFSQLNTDNTATLRNTSAEQLADPYTWKIRFDYDTKNEEGQNQEGGADPINNPPRINRGFTVIKRAVAKDIDDKPILNKAGYRYDPPLEVDIYCPTVNIERVEASFSTGAAMTLVGTVNASGFAGAPARSVLLSVLDGSSFTWTDANGVEHERWTVTYEVIHNPFGWDPEVLEQGFYTKDKKRILDENKQPMSEPFPLNSSGAKGDPENPIFTKWKILKESNFGALGIASIV